jgi:hypothetical protein
MRCRMAWARSRRSSGVRGLDQVRGDGGAEIDKLVAPGGVVGDGRLRLRCLERLALERIGKGGRGVPEGAAFLAPLGLPGAEHLDQFLAALVVQGPEERPRHQVGRAVRALAPVV